MCICHVFFLTVIVALLVVNGKDCVALVLAEECVNK